jgi:hypothetical protein
MAGTTHKIPQNVTKYEGRIIGNFTAKQFIFLAIGGIAAFLIFNSPLAQLYKIILIVVTIVISLILSIVRVQGRTTDEWMAHFFRAVNYPTQRIWRKAETPPAFLLPGYHVGRKKSNDRTMSRPELEKFIQLWKPTNQNNDYSTEEKAVLERVKSHIRPADPSHPTPGAVAPPPALSNLPEKETAPIPPANPS